MEVPSGEIILSGLSMPHSPRFYKDELYLLESGTGSLVKVNLAENSRELVVSFDCFIRGLSFHEHYAIIGKSQIRETSTDFNDLPIKENSKHAGVIIFCMKTQKIIGEIHYTADVQEIFDVGVFENVVNAVEVTNEIEKLKDVITFPGNVFKRMEKEG